jgi:hypothetical protein
MIFGMMPDPLDLALMNLVQNALPMLRVAIGDVENIEEFKDPESATLTSLTLFELAQIFSALAVMHHATDMDCTATMEKLHEIIEAQHPEWTTHGD